jgi:putative cardiolipin synthase
MHLRRRAQQLIFLATVALMSACASLPPGTGFPKSASTALAHPEETRLGRQFEGAMRDHDTQSAFRLVSLGVDGFLVRIQMIDAAEQTLDLEYYIFRQDDTGQLITAALLRAADRGVRVRVLLDDADTVPGDEQIATLAAHPRIEVRVFNPFAYRGHSEFVRDIEFALNSHRLDYRMHNKLFVVDNAIALAGGRNIGDEYFQVDPDSQFGDDDVFVAGPIVRQLSKTFDEFWNCDLAIPVGGLGNGLPTAAALQAYRTVLEEHRRMLESDGTDYVSRLATGEPFGGILSGRLPLVWTGAQVTYDSPDKKRVEQGRVIGRLMHGTVAEAAASVKSELLIVTPYFVPGASGVKLFHDVRERGAHVRILTNSLDSTPEPLAQAGYMHYRIPLLEQGVELYEVRAQLGNTRGSGQSAAAPRAARFALHAKLFVFDQERLYVGSMNFDERSHYLNTEVGLIIDSPELAQQTARRFAAIVVPANSYQPTLRADAAPGAPRLVWRTEEGAALVEYDVEPASSDWKRLKVHLMTLLPLDREL